MDDFLKFVSNMDQFTAILGEYSRFIAAYYNGLVNSGVDQEHAVLLTQNFQNQLLDKIFVFMSSYKKTDE